MCILITDNDWRYISYNLIYEYYADQKLILHGVMKIENWRY